MIGSNEGRACDAVIRRIEEREGNLRRDIFSPERDNHPARVELVCSIGDKQFAFEHTRIEPFERYIKLEAKEQEHFQPIRDKLKGRLPPNEHFVLHLPVKATLALKPSRLETVQDAIVEWVKLKAPTLPIARHDCYVSDLNYHRVKGVPFEITLHRVARGGLAGEISFVHLIEVSIEAERQSRILRAYEKKIGKLEHWRKGGARSVLIFEEKDVWLTDLEIVANVVSEIEKTAINKPDELYLLRTPVAKPWTLCALRVDDHACDDFSVGSDSLTQIIDPSTLIDLTGRQ